MGLQLIDLGASANNGLGDKLRVGGDKINDNFTEVYDKLVSDNFVVVKTLSDFPTPVGNLITLADNTTYLITAEIDTLGNSIALGYNSPIVGASNFNCGIVSSVLLPTLITGVSPLNISNLYFDGANITTFISISGAFVDDKVLIEKCNIKDFLELGDVTSIYTARLLSNNFTNCGVLNIDGSIGSFYIDKCVSEATNNIILFSVLSTCTISKRLSITNNDFICNGISIGISVSPTAIIPISGYNLENNNFTGTSTTYIDGLSHTSSKAFFKNNIGIHNTIETGFARYLDTVYTLASPLTINSGVTATLTNNANSRLETQLPSDMSSMFNSTTQKILAKNDGDAYAVSIRFKAKINVLNGYFDVKLDIGGSQGVISQESVIFSRGANTEQRFDIDLTIFSGSTFVANGGTLQINPQNGDMQIYDISFVLVRTHKAQ